MAVQVHHRSGGRAAPGSHDVDSRIGRRVLWPAGRDDVLDVESVARETLAEKRRARFVLFARGIDGRYAHEIYRQLHDLLGGAVDLMNNVVDRGCGHERITITECAP